MTDSDKEFVRVIVKHRRLFFNANRISLPVEEMDRLLTLLIEAEGMRKKAEFYRHPDCTVEQHTFSANRLTCKHDWSDLDWIEAERKEIEG